MDAREGGSSSARDATERTLRVRAPPAPRTPAPGREGELGRGRGARRGGGPGPAARSSWTRKTWRRPLAVLWIDGGFICDGDAMVAS
jgi:hypothetical protein